MSRDRSPEPCENDNIDVRQIMAQIRRRVEEQRKANAYPGHTWDVSSRPLRPSSSDGSLSEHIDAMRQAAMIDVLGEPIRSHRPILGFFVKSFKKFCRYWVRKYTDSLFLRQSYFNAETAAAMDTMRQELEELRAAVAELNEKPPHSDLR